MRRASLLLLARVAAASAADGQGVRERMRQAPRATTVTESQAAELTLTVTPVEMRPIQIWVRTAGSIDQGRRTISAFVPAAQAPLLKVGQRVRAFPPQSRSSMYQARVTGVAPVGGGATVQVTLAGPPRENSLRYVLEIVTEGADLLSVANEAIIESGGKPVVYVRDPEGNYSAREIQPGIQGEMYTEIVGGLKAAEQVVTFGSFFIDADHKLKGS